MTVIERMACAIYVEGSGRRSNWLQTPESVRNFYRAVARKALAAAKYEDGVDEEHAIVVAAGSRHDAVSLVEMWDGLIDAHLGGGS